MAFFRYADGLLVANGREDGALFFKCGDDIVAGIALDKDNIDFLIEALKDSRNFVSESVEDSLTAREIVKRHKRTNEEIAKERISNDIS